MSAASLIRCLCCVLLMLAYAADAQGQKRRKGRRARPRAPAAEQQPSPPPEQDPYGGQQPPPQDPYGYGGQQPPPPQQDPYGYGGQQPPPEQPAADPYGYNGPNPYGYGEPSPQGPQPSGMPAQVPMPEGEAEVEPLADGTAPDAAPSGSSPDVTLALSAGVTGRAAELPTENGVRKLEIGLVPALAIELGARFGGDGYHVQVGALYQSSVGLDGGREPFDPAGPTMPTAMHTHRLEVGITPAYHFASGPDSVSLGARVGYGLRAFASVVELPFPRYTLHGPLLRVELELPFAERAVVVRVAPELHVIVSATHDLRALGSVDKTGLAIGGEASLQVEVTSWAHAQLAYRESHASAGTAYGDSFTDGERFVLLGAVIHYFPGGP